MADANRQDLRIIGETNSAGGQFGKVRITGECTFSGDVDCTKLSCMGETKVAGSLRASELKLTGEVEIDGSLDAGHVGGRGELEVSSRMRGEHIKLMGNLEVGGDCEAGVFDISGAFNVKGLVSAESLNVKMYGPCRAREIGGGTLTVKRSRASALIHLFKPNTAGDLIADSIEGDVVELQHTTAGVVRGKRVTIGPGCVIERVEYAEMLDIHKSSTVKEMIRQA
ncbi:hypothetical protein [Cohnella yongneupensis]|uniref:Polymer-forming cytoskeletal protein n=1 Tax=Cohnella yongneupensis TaxID=425006 RepID=A0ABW0R2T1_9BACL